MSTKDANTGEIKTVDELLKLPKEEQREAVKEGRFKAPKLGTKERAEFDRVWIKGEAPSAPETPPSAPEKVAVEGEPPVAKPPEPPKPPEKKGEPSQVPPESAPEKVAVEEEFDITKLDPKAKKKFEEIQALLDKQQELNTRLSNTSTTNGRRVAELEAQLRDVGEKLAKKKDETPEVELEVPVPPDPAQYADEGGVVSDKYLADRAKYDQDVAKYLKAIGEDRKKLRTELNEVRGKADEASTYITDFRQTNIKTQADAAAQAFEASTDELQKMLGLETSKPWRIINQNVKILGDATAAPEAKEAAQAFINSLDKQDVGKFNKLYQAANLAFDLSTPVPKPRYDLKSHQFKGALIDAGFTVKDSVPPKAPEVDLTKLHQEHQSQGVDGIPPEKIGSDEPSLSGVVTQAEKTARLKELENMRQANPVRFKENKVLWDERLKLAAELGYAVTRA